jgi:hypothetical protein
MSPAAAKRSATHQGGELADRRARDDGFPMRERLRFRDSLGLGLLHMRRRPAFAMLPRGHWQVFTAIACYWQSNAEAWPSQETIASFAGYTSRAVRDYVHALERGGIVRLRRERRPDGSERLYYAPGLVTLRELAAFAERYPRAPTKAPTSHPPEAVSGIPPEASSGELRDQDQIEPSSCETVAKAPPEEEETGGPKDDEEVARRALAERMAKKHPMRPPPRLYEAGEVAMVAACAAMLEGDAETKMAAQRDAIAGAFHVSKDGPPTVRFIWGKLDHFLDHVERGKGRRLARERAAEPIARENAGPPTPMPDEVRTELDKLFGGPGWRATRGPL